MVLVAMTVREFVSIVFRRLGVFLSTIVAYFLTITLGSCLLPVSFTSISSVFLQGKTLEVSQLDKNNPTVSRVTNVTLADVLSEVEIILGEELRYRVIEDLSLAESPPRPRLLALLPPDAESNRISWASYLANNLEVEPAANASVVTIAFTDSDPERAAKIVNGVTQSYLSFRMALGKQEPLLDLLLREREQSRKALDAAQENLRNFDIQWDLFAASTQKDELLELLTDTDLEIGQLDAGLTAKRAEVAVFERNLAEYTEEIRKIEPVLLDQGIQFLEDRLSALEIELTNLLIHNTEIHSSVRRVRQNIEEIEARLRAKTEVVLRSVIFLKQQEIDYIRSQLATYRLARADLESRLESIRTNEIESDSRSLDLRMREDNFEMISKRLDQVRFDSALGKSGRIDVIVTSKGFPPAARSFPPKFSLLLLFAFTTAPFVALSAVLVLDHLDHTFRSADEVERYLGVRVLGTVRATSEPRLDVANDDAPPPSPEAT